jgi:hypothetical protein
LAVTEKRFNVVCTGRGQHGRITWPGLILADDRTIRQETARQAASPIRGIVEGIIDGERVSGPLDHRTVVRVESHRSERGTWQWKCKRCGIDKPLSEDHLRAWMNATPGSVLDISHLPR